MLKLSERIYNRFMPQVFHLVCERVEQRYFSTSVFALQPAAFTYSISQLKVLDGLTQHMTESSCNVISVCQSHLLGLHASIGECFVTLTSFIVLVTAGTR